MSDILTKIVEMGKLLEENACEIEPYWAVMCPNCNSPWRISQEDAQQLPLTYSCWHCEKEYKLTFGGRQ